MELNVVDAGMALVVLISLLVGAWRGFLFEVFSLAGWVCAFFAARWLANDVAVRLPMEGASAGLRHGLGFVLVFVAAAFVAGLLSWLVRKLASKVGLRPVDRVLGATFGLLRAGLLLLLIAAGVGLTPWARHEAWLASPSAQLLTVVARDGQVWLPQELLKVIP